MMHSVRLLFVLAFAGIALGTAGDASAQFSGGNASVFNMTRNYLYNRPTVSPYLQLTTRDASVGMPNYFTQVRPQLEARENEVRMQRQSAAMQRQLNQVQDQMRASQQQASGQMFTGQLGWSARGLPRFGSHMSYYPGFRAIGR